VTNRRETTDYYGGGLVSRLKPGESTGDADMDGIVTNPVVAPAVTLEQMRAVQSAITEADLRCARVRRRQARGLLSQRQGRRRCRPRGRGGGAPGAAQVDARAGDWHGAVLEISIS